MSKLTNENELLKNLKRHNYIEWEDFFMGVALLAAQRSKDPCTQVGAAIVNEDNIIVGVGYNGMPVSCSDDEFPWRKDSENFLENKFAYVCHAEMNAILNKNTASLKGTTIYTTLFPCNECAKLIIQSKIKCVVYLNEKPLKPQVNAAKKLFNSAKIEYKKFNTKQSQLMINFKENLNTSLIEN